MPARASNGPCAINPFRGGHAEAADDKEAEVLGAIDDMVRQARAAGMRTTRNVFFCRC